MARQRGLAVTLLSLHDPAGESMDSAGGLRTVSLGLESDCPRSFLDWLAANPQDVVITSDVSRIEPAYPCLPPATRHIVHIHDSGRRYRAVACRHAASIDGVICVARHIENRLKPDLQAVGFKGLVRTIHNGAIFPPPMRRVPPDGPLRLLFLGRVDPFKGVSDLVPLLKRLKEQKIPVLANIVGGANESLRRKLAASQLDGMITWAGHVPHEQCYRIAAASDILLMLSRKEPFGMVTIEAMSMGCVPIAYDIPSGSTEIIEQGKSGLLLPLGDLPAWAEAIRELALDRARLAQMSAAAVERARGTFNAEVMAQRIVAFLHDVSANARRHPARRERGFAPADLVMNAGPPGVYQRLPAGFRTWVRRVVGASPKLCHWWLNR